MTEREIPARVETTSEDVDGGALRLEVARGIVRRWSGGDGVDDSKRRRRRVSEKKARVLGNFESREQTARDERGFVL